MLFYTHATFVSTHLLGLCSHSPLLIAAVYMSGSATHVTQKTLGEKKTDCGMWEEIEVVGEYVGSFSRLIFPLFSFMILHFPSLLPAFSSPIWRRFLLSAHVLLKKFSYSHFWAKKMQNNRAFAKTIFFHSAVFQIYQSLAWEYSIYFWFSK